MKYPAISKQPRRSVNVPELSGGVNLRDSISMIGDNQLTECKNMWYHNGILKTRPACKAFSEFKIGRATSDEIVGEFKSYPHINKDGKVLHSLQKVQGIYDGYSENLSYIVTTIFWWQGTAINDAKAAGGINISGLQNKFFLPYLVVEKDGTLYCYSSNRKVYANKYRESTVWNSVDETADDSVFHIPLIMSGCKTLNFQEYSEDHNITGTQIEGYNLLGSYYKMQYTKINRELGSVGDGYLFAAFRLLNKIDASAMSGKSVKLKYLNSQGITVEHEVKIDGNQLSLDGWYVETPAAADNCCLAVKDWTAKLCGFDGYNTSEPIKWVLDDYVDENDLEIIAPCTNTDKNFNKVCQMTQAEWFGGSSKGINGGSRLFLTGNSTEGEEALVIWSGLNDPLYFSENNYFYVGNQTQRATGFGKQSDKLIIFKENETYYTYYQQNDDISADELIDQSVVDYTASSVYFPLALINSSIGCDCPGTIQLCRNRLVWAHTNGKVYTLTSESQYTERNIFEISEMIENKLKTEGNNLSAATSADFEGYYLLFVENRVYAMNYNSYGYQYVYSFTKNEDANLKIPWYVWEFAMFNNFPELNSYYIPTASIINNRLVLNSFYNAEGAVNVSMMAFSIDPDDTDTFDLAFSENGEQKFGIESMIQTKVFDFGAPNYRKNVDLVQLSLGNNEGAPIAAQFVTDSGSEEESIVLTDAETSPKAAGYVTSVALNPCIRSVIRFGIKLSCKGILAVDGMSLTYRLLGGAR